MTLIDSPAVARQRLPARRADHWARSPDSQSPDADHLTRFRTHPVAYVFRNLKSMTARPCRRIVSFLWKEYVSSVGSTSALKKEKKSGMGTILLTLRGREVLCVVREDDDAEWLDETEVNMSQTSLAITTASEEEALPVVTLNESLATPWDEDNIN
ncbi:hypothetical protein EVAR_31064_1 [Eumeta japonica]|uniref:Uncharacterized protein n=1 Tax=Eumeta variegata TaxID=151549 RepID=A0A4C1XD15_EUMVA|nr:hypothetical protein EVAR_31064_1 [Eumeta japonica]